MEIPSDIRRVKANAEKDLLEIEGVTGVGVGEKITKGNRTGVASIRVYVKKKAAKTRVPKGQLIPSDIDGVPTDVIDREFVLHPAAMPVADLQLMADAGTYDPLQGGISIGPCRVIDGKVYLGTLGLVVEDNSTGERMMLSNFHVMCVDDAWSVGNTIAQPSRAFDGGVCPADIVGEVTRASLGGQVDCAVSRITARGNNCNIVGIGSVDGTATAVDGEAVRKRGRTTELTHGFVDDESLSATVDYGNGLGNVTLTNQIGIEVDPSQSTQFGTDGDSGSVVVNASNEVIGLYYAGNGAGTYGVANPIQAVFSALDIRLCTPILTAPWIDEWTNPALDAIIDERIPETLREIIDTVREAIPTFRETSPWADYGFTPNKAIDDVKDPAGYDTMMETIQEANTIQEHAVTIQEVAGFDPRIPVDPRATIPAGPPGGRVPFGLATPHHAAGAPRFEAAGGEGDLEAEIERAKQYLEALEARRRGR